VCARAEREREREREREMVMIECGGLRYCKHTIFVC